jgi:hypothetical protein
VGDLEFQILKRITERLERLEGVSREEQDRSELRSLISALELSRRAAAGRPKRGPIDWPKLLPLVLALAVLLAAIAAALLGVDVRSF